jgi:subtilisin family serine protease
MVAHATPPNLHRRRSAGRDFRVHLQVELLEDRSLLSVQLGSGVETLALSHPFTRTEVVVSVHSDQPLADLAGAVRAAPGGALAAEINLAGLRRLFGRDGTSVVEVGLAHGADPLKVVQDLDMLPFVTWASPNFIYNPPGAPSPTDFDPNDPLYPQQAQHSPIQDNLAWDYTQGDPRIIIAVTDDGVDTNHEDLYQNIWINQAKIPPSRLKNLVDVDGDGYISFADLNNPINQGPFKITDINGDGRIDAADLLAPMDVDANGNDLGTGGWAVGRDTTGDGYVDDLVGWSTINGTNNPNPRNPLTEDHGTHVAGIAAAQIDDSLGGAGVAGHATIMPIRFYDYRSGDWTSAVIAESFAFATDHGARIVNTSYTWDDMVDDPIMLAGLQYMYDGGVLHINSAGNNMMADPPREEVDTTLFVVSTDANDHKGLESNWGWGMDLAAPGELILSTLPNNRYGVKTGTSMAAPAAAGVAALIWSLHPDWTRDQVAAQLIGTADIIDALNPTQCRGSCAGQLGAGRVNANRAVTETIAPPRLRDVIGLPAEGGSTTQSIQSFQVDVASVFDPATVNDPRNWELFKIRRNGQAVPIPLTHTTTLGGPYMIGTNRLYFTTPYPLPHGTYQFRAVSGGLTDPFGTALDGDDSGQPGQDFVLHFTVLDPGDSASAGKAENALTGLATAMARQRLAILPAIPSAVFAPIFAAALDAATVPAALRNQVLWSPACQRADSRSGMDAETAVHQCETRAAPDDVFQRMDSQWEWI